MKFFKKLMIILSLVTTLHAEAQLDITLHDALKINLAATQAPEAWVGIYKKGTSNDWENVLLWDWVDDGTLTFKVFLLPEGDYEARLFFNNSFISETSVPFHLIERPSNNNGKRFLDKNITAYQNDLTLNLTYRQREEKDWVGIFRQGAEYNRANLLAWTYIIDDKLIQNVEIFDKNGLAAGDYDIVYFTNNKYNSTLGQISTLTVKNNIAYSFNGTESKDVLIYSPLLNGPNNWIALFKRNAAPIKENILAWSYLRDGEVIFASDKLNKTYFSNFPTIGNNQTLKVVLFKNDTYEILAQTNAIGENSPL